MQLYELKEIQSEDDLPKEEGVYMCKNKHQGIWNQQFYPTDKFMRFWLNHVHSYFSPVSVEKETVYVSVSVMEELPKSDDFYFTMSGEHSGNNWFRNGKWIDEILSNKPSQVTHWLKQSEVLIVKQ